MNNIILTGKTTGRNIKPLHGVGGGPLTKNLTIDASRFFKEARIPYARLHDVEYPLGCGHFVDIHCVFPNFDADPEEPSSYDFFYTDRYIAAIQATGAEAFYRLGESIDHSPAKRYVTPPKDMSKWAAICEGIVRHYNEGWADGFHYGLKYWEIWNEPENPPMWTGTQAEYFELYRITANRLKASFPDIKTGGYASCGFYGITNPNVDDFFRSFIPYFTDFLTYISTPETYAPLDFFSWHIYSQSPSEVATHAAFVRKTLDEYGFTDTESILDEWNLSGPDMFNRMRSEVGGAFVGATVCMLQSPAASVDCAIYYDAQPEQSYGGIFHRHTLNPTKAYYTLKSFSELYTLKNEAETVVTGDLPVAAAVNGNKCAIMAVNYSASPSDLSIKLPRCLRTSVYITDKEHDMEKLAEFTSDEAYINLPPYSVALFTAE